MVTKEKRKRRGTLCHLRECVKSEHIVIVLAKLWQSYVQRKVLSEIDYLQRMLIKIEKLLDYLQRMLMSEIEKLQRKMDYLLIKIEKLLD